jgi:hypothetical protein
MGEVIDMIGYKIDDLVFCEFLPEMFRRVGLPSSDINNLTKVPQWFLTKQWTTEDEEEFVKWLVQRLMYKMKMSRKLAEREARMFILNYGWVCSDGGHKQLELPLGD